MNSFGAVLGGVMAAVVTAAMPPGKLIAAQPKIEVWYGLEQAFGAVGNPQRWVNVLGNVTSPDRVATLTYSLNGGNARPLNLGCDLRRLARPGDFNVELERATLKEGANEIRLVATDREGGQQSQTVMVHITKGRKWPLPYAIDWGKVRRIHDVAEVVDGLWRIEPTGVRTVQPYYDRVLAIGDTSWSDYEVETTITYHDFMATPDARKDGPPFANLGSAGFLLRWQGHHDDGKQPRAKWNPTGGLATLRGRAGPEGNIWTIHGGESGILARQKQARHLELERPYRIKARVETLPGPKTRYSAKLWATSETEPHDWDLAAEDGAQDAQSGSLLFVVHHSDVTIGNIRISPLSRP